MSAFDTARDIRLPGVVVESVYFDPKLLSTRMKNAVKKMLREGKAAASWSSKSKALALKLAEACDLRVVGVTHWGFHAPPRNTYGTDQVEEIMRLIDADEAMELMQDAQQYGTGDQRSAYVQKRTRERHDRNRDVIRNYTEYRWIAPSANREFMHQMIGIFASTRTAAELEKVEKVCDKIDNGERIAITISM